MQFDPTISMGTVIQIAAMIALGIAGWYAFKAKIEVFENTLREHAKSMTGHASRLDTHETRILELVGNVQRLIGFQQANQIWNGHERREER